MTSNRVSMSSVRNNRRHGVFKRRSSQYLGSGIDTLMALIPVSNRIGVAATAAGGENCRDPALIERSCKSSFIIERPKMGQQSVSFGKQGGSGKLSSRLLVISINPDKQ